MKLENEQQIPQDEIRQAKKQKLVNSNIKISPGHTVFIVKLSKPFTIEPAKYDDGINVNYNSQDRIKKIVVPEGCVAVAALNKRNVLKKLNKSYRDTPKPAPEKPADLTPEDIIGMLSDMMEKNEPLAE